MVAASIGAAMLTGAAGVVPNPVARDQIVEVPVTEAAGLVTQLRTRLCRPASDAPARLVVINHGTPGSASRLPTIHGGTCRSEAARWFLDRGYVVMLPLRRGYGATGGPWAEDYGPCDQADFARAGLETARDIAAAVTYGAALPFVRPTGVVVVGHSAGGWGAMAYDSLPHPQGSAFISMAGGRGAHLGGVPDHVCHPERLDQAAARFGATASTPMLWIYAANDTYFPPPVAEAMHAAFAGAGGAAKLVEVGPYDSEGHNLIVGRNESPIWGPYFEAYLAAHP